ncbi:MAG: radical SAM protein [Elusimicrobia bacterium]|nr:radical SAM protein [Elusimicrobiota bacterium]
MKTTNYILNLNELLSNKTKLKSKPQILQIFLSNICNLDCIMCCNKTTVKREKAFSLDYKTIEKIILTNSQLLVIEWLGGEPTLYPNFEKLLDLANKQNIKQVLVTNGSLLNKKIINKLIEYNVDVTISMDAPIKSLYEKIRRGGDFNRLVNNLKLFVKEKKKKKHDFNLLTVNYVVLNNNYKYILKMISFIRKLGIKNIFFENDITNGIYNISKISKSKYKHFQKVLLNIKNHKDENTNILIDENFFQSEAEPIKNFSVIKKDDNKCLVPWVSCCIKPNGDVLSSPFCLCVLGNIYKSKFLDIWNSKKFVGIRKKIINNNFELENICSNCKNMHPITRMYRALDRATKILFRN